MLILSEENKRLKGTKYVLPEKIVDRFWQIILKYPGHMASTGYIKAKNVVKDDGVVTMEWLKNMKAFFDKHQNENDIEFVLGGGYLVKTYVDNRLEQLTSQFPRVKKKSNPTKIRKDSSNLGGNRGEKQSKQLSIVTSLMSDIIPKFESIENNKTIIITEDQLKEISNYLNNN